ncbi:MAG: HDOD domain-containing protein [Phycisphaerales bacterium]
MSNEALERVLNCASLPSLPAVAIEVLELTADQNVAMAKLAGSVQKDPAISAKVLKTINSSFYGLAKPCGSIERAIAYLGLNTVKSLVLGFSLVDSFSNLGEGYDLTGHWRRAIYSATAAQIFGRTIEDVDEDEAFTAALFQDIGAMAMFIALKQDYTDAIGTSGHDEHAKLERDRFGFDHATAGAELCKKWKLPKPIIEGVRLHHAPERGAGDWRSLVRLVGLSRLCADSMGHHPTAEQVTTLIANARAWFGEAFDVREQIGQIAEAARMLAKVFERPVGGAPDVEQITAMAQERSFEHQMQVQRQAEEMARQAYTDALTGAANRQRFDEELVRLHDEHVASGASFGMLFLDADKFKSVNDTHGHAAGDAVLIELVRRATEVVGDAGVVCRYGGEEFGVLLPGAGRRKSMALAERVRLAIEAQPFDLTRVECEADEIRVTVSIGVAATDCLPEGRVEDAQRLVAEADRAVYAAKQGGRNTVRVWGRLRNADEIEDAVAAETSSVRAGEAAPMEGTSGTGERVRVWLVEDDALAAVLLRTMLVQRRGVDVEWARSYQECQARIEQARAGEIPVPDVIACDHQLDQDTGIGLLEQVRGVLVLSEVPFFVLTAASDQGVQEAYERANVAGFVQKTKLAAEMNKWITAIVDAGAAHAASGAGAMAKPAA